MDLSKDISHLENKLTSTFNYPVSNPTFNIRLSGMGSVRFGSVIQTFCYQHDLIIHYGYSCLAFNNTARLMSYNTIYSFLGGHELKCGVRIASPTSSIRYSFGFAVDQSGAAIIFTHVQCSTTTVEQITGVTLIQFF